MVSGRAAHFDLSSTSRTLQHPRQPSARRSHVHRPRTCAHSRPQRKHAPVPQPTPTMPPDALRIDRGFHIGHQRVQLDVDFTGRRIVGTTEITVLPTDLALRSILLDLRQAKVTAASVNGKPTLWDYEDFWAATASDQFAETARSVLQFDKFRDKLRPITEENLPAKLAVHLPRNVKVTASDPYSSGITPVFSRHGSPDIAATPVTRGELSSAYEPLILRISFTVENPSMGISFIHKSKKHRYEHVYTYSNPYGISTSSWLPCVDGLWERCSWEFEITVPNTLGDLKRMNTATKRRANGYSTNGASEAELEKEDEDDELEINVVCVGDLVNSLAHPTHHNKKTVFFLLPSPVAAQHVGFAVGPFVAKNLAELRESEDDHTNSSLVDVVAYALPGRQDDVINTCMFMNKAMEYFTREYSSYPFGSFILCFVEDTFDDMEPYAGLAIASDHHLFPQDVIDPIFTETKYLTSLLAAQWCGVNIVPKYWHSAWITIGICRYITGMFLRKLMGNNEYRFRLKKDAEKICKLDINRPPIGNPSFDFPLDKDTLGFIALKAPVVLHILDRRLTKSGGSFGLTRVIPKLFWQAMSGDLTNGALSTSHFQRVCEKVSHTKVDTFFQEWVFGSGYPIFRITQRFNKKKMFVEMGIRQVQNAEIPNAERLSVEDFVSDANRYLNNPTTATTTIRAAFTGPMTMRIHEADGTPYDHVVHIKDSFTKLDIQYNTKYKRLKRHLRQRDKQGPAASALAGNNTAISAAAHDVLEDGDLDGVLLHSLGDVLSSTAEMQEWRLSEWSKEEEDAMSNEAFEWLRVDSDFEWIGIIYINQPDYMYASQLQQDRDVVAQYESVRFFAAAKASPMYSTILARTLMDRRYYYGVRVEAALALARHAVPDVDWIGQYHLVKAFQTIFCFPDSLIPQANNFSDFATYFIQKAIPRALASVRDEYGHAPMKIREFLYDLLRYNENSNNSCSDCFYVASLMEDIASTIEDVKMPAVWTEPVVVPVPVAFEKEEDDVNDDFNFEFDFDFGESAPPSAATAAAISIDAPTNGNGNGNGAKKPPQQSADRNFVDKAIAEIDRCQNMDTWTPSYASTVSRVALELKERLSRFNVISLRVADVLAYTRPDREDGVRIAAFAVLLSMPDLYNVTEAHHAALAYVFRTIAHAETARNVRVRLIKLLGESIGKIVLNGSVGGIPGVNGGISGGGGAGDFMIIEDSGLELVEQRQEDAKRASISGCIDVARAQFSRVDALQRGIYECILRARTVGVWEKKLTLDFCAVLYTPLPAKVVRLKIPDRKKVVARNLGGGKIVFYRADK
ncbi:uncharacterized protein V1518DRAFT_421804 [Limtongia smithiae]|uniref:uncharacterized protein n=1 Tax=Limtongia smithiae TaxID=1125753 RepID=UPI0034CDCA2F